MPDFTKDELVALQIGLDTMVRAEGGSLAQVGIKGLQSGNADVLATRLGSAVSAIDKINAAIEAIDTPLATQEG